MAFNQHRFLECFAICGRVCEAARWAKIHRCQHAEWMQNDSTYPERFRRARMRAAQELEDEAVQRAREGVCRPVLHRGKQVYVGGRPLFDYEKSDQLLIRLLEANDPDRFKRRVENTNLLDMDFTKLSPDQLQVIADQFIKTALGTSDPALVEAKRLELEAKVKAVEGTAVEVPAPSSEISAGQYRVCYYPLKHPENVSGVHKS
jgi:hypothetical protein